MALPFKQTNRRQFLGRSALGAGSLLFGPLLLESCTDHSIPVPNPGSDSPVVILPVGPSSSDWNADARSAVTIGLAMVPEVGGILSGLTRAFWRDSSGTPWNQIRDQVKQLKEQKFDDGTFNTAAATLDGLPQDLVLYLSNVNDGKPDDIKDAYSRLLSDMTGDIDSFTTEGYEVMLLPLYVQYANLYIHLLRDPLIPVRDASGNLQFLPGNVLELVGHTWGMPQSLLDSYQGLLTGFITEAAQWVSKWYLQGRANIINNIGENRMTNEPFKSANAYDRLMIQLALDYMDTWPYCDVSLYKYLSGAVNPDGTSIPLFTREIYSDPVGNTYLTTDPNSTIILPRRATRLPTKIYVWSGERINAVEVFYDNGGGPDGLEKTNRMGDQNGGSPNPTILTLTPDNPVLQVEVSYEKYQDLTLRDYRTAIDSLVFTCNDTQKFTMGVNKVGEHSDRVIYIDPVVISYDHRALSSIYIHGVSNIYNNSADCIVFGFLYWQSLADTLRAISNFYIKSPTERSAADFMKAYPQLGLSEASFTDQLKAAREAYW